MTGEKKEEEEEEEEKGEKGGQMEIGEIVALARGLQQMSATLSRQHPHEKEEEEKKEEEKEEKEKEEEEEEEKKMQKKEEGLWQAAARHSQLSAPAEHHTPTASPPSSRPRSNRFLLQFSRPSVAEARPLQRLNRQQ